MQVCFENFLFEDMTSWNELKHLLFVFAKYSSKKVHNIKSIFAFVKRLVKSKWIVCLCLSEWLSFGFFNGWFTLKKASYSEGVHVKNKILILLSSIKTVVEFGRLVSAVQKSRAAVNQSQSQFTTSSIYLYLSSFKTDGVTEKNKKGTCLV